MAAGDDEVCGFGDIHEVFISASSSDFFILQGIYEMDDSGASPTMQGNLICFLQFD
jgi:hypothetical protein